MNNQDICCFSCDFFDFFFICLFFIICLFICLFFLSQNFSTEKNVMSEWIWSIYSDSHHTPHTVYAIDFLIRLSIDCIWLVSFDSVNEQSRYLLFFIRLIFFSFMFLLNCLCLLLIRLLMWNLLLIHLNQNDLPYMFSMMLSIILT